MDPNLQSFLQSTNLQGLMNNNPDTMKQMEGFWKFLDNMAESNPDEYKKFIDEQMSDMKQEIKKEKQEEVKNQTIQSEPAFCIKALIARKVEEKDRKQQKDKGVQLFDFNDQQIKENFLESDEKKEPLEEPKIYLNVVYSDYVLPPLNKQRDIANLKNDREWLIIPVAFNEPQTRKSLDGLQCIHYDAHVNTCVIEKMREEKRTMTSISNYIIMKFQEHVKDQFIIHKKSVKVLKKKRYKDYKGSNYQKVYPYVLPKENDIRSFKKVKEQIAKENKEKQGLASQQKEVKLPTFTQGQEQSNILEQIKIPGTSQQSQPNQIQDKKKPLIVEVSSKTKPNYELQDLGREIVIVINVEDENSAKDIDLDISDSQLKLNSQNYELVHDFQDYRVSQESVQAKFNKAKKTLTLKIEKM